MDINKLTLESFMGKKNYMKYLAKNNSDQHITTLYENIETHKEKLRIKFLDMLNNPMSANTKKKDAFESLVFHFLQEIEEEEDTLIHDDGDDNV